MSLQTQRGNPVAPTAADNEINPDVLGYISESNAPASVVKELIENALDAGATRITVTIEQSGTRSIKVEDNGAGIPADQVELAFSRHATSKLRAAADLLTISTLGFRGEALPAIAAVSNLTCVSRAADGNATRYQINYGQPTAPPQPTVAPVGTRIMAERLFGNQPARLNFLRTRNTEAARVQRVTALTRTHFGSVKW